MSLLDGAKSFFNSIKDDLVAGTMIELAKSFFGKLGGSAGEGIGKHIPGTIEDYMTVKFGLKTEDERLYNSAVAGMKVADRVRLAKKLLKLKSDDPNLTPEANRKLSDERFNYFRICLPLKDKEKTIRILTEYARLSDEAWERECEIMGFKFESDGIALAKVGDAIVAKHQQMNATFTAHPMRIRRKESRDSAVARANSIGWK